MSDFSKVKQHFEFDTRDARQSVQLLGRASQEAGKQQQEALGKANAGLNTLTDNLKMSAESSKLAGSSSKALTDAISLISPRAAGAARALRSMTLALAATPWGIAAAGAGLLAGGLMLLRRRKKEVTEQTSEMDEAIKGLLKHRLTDQEMITKRISEIHKELTENVGLTAKQYLALNQRLEDAHRAMEKLEQQARSGLLSRLFPEEEKARKFREEMDRLQKSLEAGEIDADRYHDAVIRLENEFAGATRTIKGKTDALRDNTAALQAWRDEMERAAERARDFAQTYRDEVGSIFGRDPRERTPFLGTGLGALPITQDAERMRAVMELEAEAHNARVEQMVELRNQRAADLEQITGLTTDLDLFDVKLSMITTGFQALTGAASEAWGVLVTGSERSGKALKELAGNALLGLSMEMFGNALKHSAMAAGSLALGRPDVAALHGKAAAMHGAGAVALGGMARALGAGQGPSGGGALSPTAGRGPAGGGGRTFSPTIILGNDWADQSPRERSRQVNRALERARRAGEGSSSVRDE
jgi:LPXTG-motif cell wall-anchored protein